MTKSTPTRRPWAHRARDFEGRAWLKWQPRGAHWVYFIFDATSDDLLYVGCTNDIIRRVAEHHGLHRYRREDVRYEVEGPYTESAGLAAERRHIRALRPKDNQRMTVTRVRAS